MVRGRRVQSISRAGAFVEDVGFALLFPSERVLVPSLWEAVAGRGRRTVRDGHGRGRAARVVVEGRVPAPRPCLVRQLRRRPRLFSVPDPPAVALPAHGETNDHTDLDLSATAHEIATALSEGPQRSPRLRALNGDRSRYQRAAVELHMLPVGHHRRRSRTGLRVAVHCPGSDVSKVRRGRRAGPPGRRGAVHRSGARRICPRPGPHVPMAGWRGMRTPRHAPTASARVTRSGHQLLVTSSRRPVPLARVRIHWRAANASTGSCTAFTRPCVAAAFATRSSAPTRSPSTAITCARRSIAAATANRPAPA